MPRTGAQPERLRVAALRNTGPTSFDIRPDEAARAALAEELGLLSLRKLRLSGEIRPVGRDGWQLDAMLGATVTQPCVGTLDPVTTRIDEPVERLWRPDEELPQPEEGSEIETPEEDADPLPSVIALGAVLSEALSLALPPYPHREAAEEVAEELAEAAEPDPEDERPNPFAALSGLRDQLAESPKKGEKDDD